MFPSAIKMRIQDLLIVLVLSFVCGQDRKITSKLNPGCQSSECQGQSPNSTLVYIRAQGSNDTLHQIWDFTKGIPTIIFSVAGLNSTLDIIWNDDVPEKFVMSDKPWYSFAAAIDKLYEYDDIDDKGHIDGHSPSRSYPLNHISWRLNGSVLSDKEVMVHLHGGLYFGDKDAMRPGIIDLKLDLLPFKDYAVDLPHLIHTANSTLVDVSLVNLTTSKDYNASRFALHFVLVSTDSRGDSMHYTMRKSLDDEHTPGVFEIIEIKTPESYKKGDGGFMQFRPVSYTQPERGVTSSTVAHVSNFNRTSIPRRSTMERFYREFDGERLLVQDMFISFGENGDGYYKQHNYTAWSFTIGYGAPPVESFSLFVIMIISIGLGVPVVLALSGIIYVLVRRYKQRNGPTRFRDDE